VTTPVLVRPTLEDIPIPQPRCALLVFGLEHNAAILTRHALTLSPQGPVVGAGTVLSERDLTELVVLLQNRPREQGAQWLPPDVLAAGPAHLAWVIPAAVRPLWCKMDEQTVRCAAPWPRLLLLARPGALIIAALKDTRRPRPITPLFHAPLMNVGASGSVCLGTATAPAVLAVASRGEWLRLLTDTWFTHVNHPHTLALKGKRQTVDNAAHMAFWKKLEKANAPAFPADALAPMGVGLGPFLRHHLA
jgi:PRTRC genetic system protein B